MYVSESAVDTVLNHVVTDYAKLSHILFDLLFTSHLIVIRAGYKQL